MRPSRSLIAGLLALTLVGAGCVSTTSEEIDPQTAGNASADPAEDDRSTDQPVVAANLTANRTQGTAPLDVAFHLDAQQNASWTLATGNGTTIEGQTLAANVDHTYTSAGNYTANLTVETDASSDVDTLEIRVEAAPSKGTQDTNETNETDENDGSEEESGSSHDEAPDCLRAVPEPADPTGLAEGWTTRSLAVAFAVDEAFAGMHADWRQTVRNHAANISAVYEEAIDVEIEVVHVTLVPRDAMVENGTTSEAIDDLRAYYDEHHADLARDAVYLFSGGGFDNAAGQADCIGGAGYEKDAYAVGEADPDSASSLGPATMFADESVKIATHEIGHLLAAHHHQANCAEAAASYEPSRPLDACTVMFNDVSLLHPAFSTANKLVMRGHVDAIHEGG
jgi:PKD repeat protein